MGLAPLDVFAQASQLGAGTKGWSLSESDLVVGSVAVLAITLGGWVWTRKFGAPSHDSEIINPFAAGGFGEYAVPVVRLLHRLQGQPVPSTNGAAVTAAPVGWVFRVLNFVDNWLYWCTSLRLVPVRRAEIQALADSLARAGEGDSTPKAVHLFLNELTREPISATGRLAVQQWITGILHVRRHVQNYVERHPEIHDVPIEAPMFIIGPPRTASSFILRLLSQVCSAFALDPLSQLCLPYSDRILPFEPLNFGRSTFPHRHQKRQPTQRTNEFEWPSEVRAFNGADRHG